MALVFFVIFFSRSFKSIHKLFFSISTKIGFAFLIIIAFAVEVKVYDGTSTSSFFFRSNNIEAISKALLQLCVKKTFLLSNYNVDFTDQVQFRFIAEDINNIGDTGTGGSIVEAAIDDFTVSSFNANDTIQGDLNYDGQLNVLDVVTMVNIVLSNACATMADINLDDNCNVLDVVILVNLILD